MPGELASLFSSPLTTLVVILLAPVVFVQAMKWLVAPIIVRHKHRVAVHPKWEQTRDEQLTAEMREFISAAVGQFVAEGFAVVANVHQSDGVPGVRAVQVMLAHPASGDRAIVIATLGATHRALVLAVKSEFADGTLLSTGSSPSPSIYPPNPLDQPINARWLRDARALCEFHRRRLAALGRTDARRAKLPPGGELGLVRRDWARELERYERIGYQYVDRSGEQCRLTWKGAFLVAWRLTEPLKSRRMRKTELKARRLWVDLGMDQWQPGEQTAKSSALPASSFLPISPSPHLSLSSPPPQPHNTSLAYESALAEGEVQQSWAGDALTIRLGAMTAEQYAARNWYKLVIPGFVLLALGFIVYQYIRFAGMGIAAGRTFWASTLPLLLGIWLVFIVFDVLKFIAALRRCRGTMVLTASPAGLWFRNAPTKQSEGHLPRDQVEGLLVAIAQPGIFRRTYQLLALLREGKPRRQMLLTAPKKRVLEEARLAALKAMGLELEAAVEVAAAKDGEARVSG